MEPFEKLAAKLSELFELEKADLDFGIHRIIKARQKHIRIFLGLDQPSATDPTAPTLRKIVQREMGELNVVELERQLDATTEKIKSNYGKLAFDEAGALAAGPAKDSADGQIWLSLKEELKSGSEQSNAQLEAEIYSHLTEFFSRYYDEADFLSKRRIKAGDTPYAVPYSGEEVMLHWANKDQYYIKSSMDLKDYTFTLPEQFGQNKRVQFKCERQDPVLNNNNAKREFHLDDEAQIEITENSLLIPFHFKIVDRNRTQPETKAWIETILKKLPPEWQRALTHTPEEARNNIITRHLANYTRKNEADFFIHKHLGKFLRGELDFYIKNEVMHLDDIDEKSSDYLATRVRLIKALRTIARHIIIFLAQLENFQKKLWLKKKYVTESHYCITLDRILAMEKGEALIATILNHIDTKIRRYNGEMRSQHQEWIKLYAINELADYPKSGKLNVEFLRAHDKLILDTVFFPQSFKWSLLAGIDDLDTSLDGLIIHSENFQALNLLQERYREKLHRIHIDPPYNTDTSGFLYKNDYHHSSWSAMMHDRLSIGKCLLGKKSLLTVNIDENEYENLYFIVSRLFQGTIETIIWDKCNPMTGGSGVARQHEYIIASSDWVVNLMENNETISEMLAYISDLKASGLNINDAQTKYREWIRNNESISGGLAAYNSLDSKWHAYQSVSLRAPEPRDNQKFHLPLYHPITKKPCPVPANGFSRTPETLSSMIERGEILFGANEQIQPRQKVILSKQTSRQLTSILTDGKKGKTYTKKLGVNFPYCHPVSLYESLLFTSELECTTLDYFAGSGTTGHAIINLNRQDEGVRKYILVETGDHFDTVIIPRIQKVVYSTDWNDGKPTADNSGISHAFKYLRLESYEDALNNLDLGTDRAPDLLGLGDQVREDYLFTYLLDVETRGHLMNLNHFRDPWGCQLKIHDPHTGKSEPRTIDLVETFHYLLGITVREVRVQGDGGGFLTIEGETSQGDTVLIIWRKLAGESEWPNTTNSDLNKFVTSKLRINPADTEYHAIYVNGDHTLEDPHSKIHCIEEVFYERMFENTGNPED
jgi:adenine-specific DNA-methyltransferase